MIRYLFCILLGVFLMLGIGSVLNEDVNKFQSETGTTTYIQGYAESDGCDSEVMIQQSYKENREVADEGYRCKSNNGILGHSFLSHTIPPSKILKINPTTLAIQILSSINSQLLKKSWTNASLDIYSTKSSYRYYVYTLGHMLI